MIFTRERGTLDLSLNPSVAIDIKNITLNPQQINKVSERILNGNAKFWVIFIHIVASRLNDFTKATLRARLLKGAF